MILKSQTLLKIRKILLILFIIINNETNGDDIESRCTTPCEKNKLIQTISTEFVDLQGRFDEITTLPESVNEECILFIQEYE